MTAGVASKDQARDLDADLAMCEAATPDALQDEVFLNIYLNDAHQGWPYAIRRAMEAENEVDKLRRELENLQDQLNRPRGCWD